MRRVTASLIVTIVSASLMAPWVAGAAGQSGVTFTSTDTRPTQFLGLGPDGLPPAELCEPTTGECLVGFIGYGRMTGAFEGNAVNVGSVSVNFTTGTGWATSLAHFTGTVQGCPGTGTATIRYEARLGAEPGKNIGTLTVVKGSGTGGLKGLTGTGSFVASPQPDGAVPSTGTARLRCGKR